MSGVKSQARVPHTERAALRRHLEGFDRIDVVSDDMRNLIEECFPDLLGKLPPKMPPAPSILRRRSPTRTGSDG